MHRKRRLAVFLGFFILAFLYWRTKVYLFSGDGELPFLREITGLTIHHFHYGLLFILIASILLIFYRVSSFSVGLMGFGLGSTFDSFVSRLFSFSSVRTNELSSYGSSFPYTLLLFANIVLLVSIFYFVKE